MMQSFAAGKVQEALQIHIQLFPLFKSLFLTSNPIPLKVALRLLGLDTGVVRLPLIAGSPELEAKLKAVLQQVEILN
jgi:4-hydroxy-tetrahydrodipicolinate synthase